MQSTDFNPHTIQSCRLNHWMCDVNDFGVLAVTGSDAYSFLQGQTTCDFKQLNSDTWIMGALCNPKGRVISIFYAVATESGFLLIVPVSTLNIVLNRLTMFILRSDVTLADVTTQWHMIGFSLSPATTCPFSLPPARGVISQSDRYLLQCHSTNKQPKRYLILCREKRLKETLSQLEHMELTNTDSTEWHLHEIANGIPVITEKTSEIFIPQMLNLDLLNAISFEKGCYTGQEIVARTQHLGTLKRRMFVLAGSSQSPAEPGTIIVSQSNQAQHRVGQVVRSAVSGKQLIMLAVILKSAAGLTDLCINTPEASALSMMTSFDPETPLP